jgi:hypothetical protein
MPTELDAEPGNEHPRSAHWRLEASAQAAAHVRHALDAVLEQWGLSEDARDAAVLVAYELIANGIDYGTENGADRLLLSASRYGQAVSTRARRWQRSRGRAHEHQRWRERPTFTRPLLS